MLQQFAAPQSGEQVSLRLGERFSLTLDEHPTTGYLWEMEWGYEQTLYLVRDQYHPSDAPQRLGADGTHEWLFEAMRPGVCTLILALRRPFQKDEKIAQAYSLQVRVGDATR